MADHYCKTPSILWPHPEGKRWKCPKCGAVFRWKKADPSKKFLGSWYLVKDGRRGL